MLVFGKYLIWTIVVMALLSLVVNLERLSDPRNPRNILVAQARMSGWPMGNGEIAIPLQILPSIDLRGFRLVHEPVGMLVAFNDSGDRILTVKFVQASGVVITLPFFMTKEETVVFTKMAVEEMQRLDAENIRASKEEVSYTSI